ncbi:hypothetical protein [Alsobacter sp. SYSU BS001988]
MAAQRVDPQEQAEARTLFETLRAELERLGMAIPDEQWERMSLVERSDWLKAAIARLDARMSE